jgi:aerobic-type carbon monoxide dehydrogenase small subunit (CoxS/CutS family)
LKDRGYCPPGTIMAVKEALAAVKELAEQKQSLYR